MQIAPWMPAVEEQLQALKIIDLLLNKSTATELHGSWRIDRKLLKAATPYSWSTETATAVLEASKSIPLDTMFNRWNLPSEACWWRFETPLPIQTVDDPDLGVRAFVFGPLKTQHGNFASPVCVWTDTRPALSQGHWQGIMPSQTFEWEDGISLQEMLQKTSVFHTLRYGPGGPDEGKGTVGHGTFMAATEALARFLLAGVAWLAQKVIVESEGHIERHRRKEFNRTTGQDIRTVRVISLRRAERRETQEDSPVCERRDYSHRFIVSGHWRNQACGPKHGDRRLTYVMPFIKGPADKPLVTKQQKKVYTVDR